MKYYRSLSSEVIVVISILVYLICASVTSLILRINDIGNNDFDCVMLGIIFPLTWFYFLIKLPIIIYEKYH